MANTQNARQKLKAHEPRCRPGLASWTPQAWSLLLPLPCHLDEQTQPPPRAHAPSLARSGMERHCATSGGTKKPTTSNCGGRQCHQRGQSPAGAGPAHHSWRSRGPGPHQQGVPEVSRRSPACCWCQAPRTQEGSSQRKRVLGWSAQATPALPQPWDQPRASC